MNLEMVDQLRLTGCARCFGEALHVAEHIDKRGFTYITPANKSKFGFIRFGTVLNGGAADKIGSLDNFHGVQGKRT